MALFDYYQPSGSFVCPVCGITQREWQGYDGPCALFVFREGVSGAVDQRVDDECRLAANQLSAQRLPDEFFIRAYDCGCPFPTELRCTSVGGVWHRAVLFTGSDAGLQLRGPERREHWQKRRSWLSNRNA